MRQLLPDSLDEVDCFEAYRPPAGAKTFVRLNMIMSGDGAVTDPEGRSGGLAGSGDREVFRVLRAHADAILVGAGTARSEGYGPHRLRQDLAARRSAEGRHGPAALVLVSRSLDFDLRAPLFADAASPTVVLTCASADRDRLAAVERAGHAVVAGEEKVDLAGGLAALRERFGLRSILCEGGPTLNGALLTAGLVDELCLTLAPLLVGAGGPRLAEGLAGTRPLHLAGALADSSELFLRYTVGGPRP